MTVPGTIAHITVAHITSAAECLAALSTGSYMTPRLQTQGFIHCSAFSADQLLAVADVLYAGQAGLVVLLIDPGRRTHEVQYEDTESPGQFFPHVYGPLDLEAVTAVLDFPPRPDGTFRLPDFGAISPTAP